MDSELSEPFVSQAVNQTGDVVDQRYLSRIIRKGKSRIVGRFQAWHCLILILTAFWIFFAATLITSDYLFLVALPIIALFSVVVIGLAWAFQNNI